MADILPFMLRRPTASVVGATPPIDYTEAEILASMLIEACERCARYARQTVILSEALLAGGRIENAEDVERVAAFARGETRAMADLAANYRANYRPEGRPLPPPPLTVPDWRPDDVPPPA